MFDPSERRMSKRVSEILMPAKEMGELSKSFKANNRDKLISIHTNVSKKSVWKKMWHKAPALNINTYKIQFTMQGEKVRFDQHDSYPICMMGVKFKPDKKPLGGQKYSKDVKNKYSAQLVKNFVEPKLTR